MQPGTMDVCKTGERPPGKPAESQRDGDILTFSNGERRVGEVEPHQLSRELAEEAAGDGAIEERAPVGHHVHQGDSLGGVGRAHNLNRHGRKGEGDMPNKMRACFTEAVGEDVSAEVEGRTEREVGKERGRDKNNSGRHSLIAGIERRAPISFNPHHHPGRCT